MALAVFFMAFFHAPVKLPVLPDPLDGADFSVRSRVRGEKAAPPAPVKITAVSPQKGSATTTVKAFGPASAAPPPVTAVPLT